MLPKLWYPGGAGGHWLNYVTWCGINQTWVDYDFIEFSPVFNNIPNYKIYYQFRPHSEIHAPTDIWLGSDQALLNFYINVLIKNPKWKNATPLGYIQMRDNFLWNLDYCDIFNDPENFFNQINALTDYNLKLDFYTNKALQQYKHSCLWSKMSEQQLQNTSWAKTCLEYCENDWDLVRTMLFVAKI